MSERNTPRNKRWILKTVLGIYIIEVLWFLYSQILNPILNQTPLESTSVELAVILSISLISMLIYLFLKRSKKVNNLWLSFVIVSLIIFIILAPLVDVYLPFLWKLFTGN